VPQQAPKTATFKELIACQHSSGYWPESCQQLLSSFFKDGGCQDAVLISELQALAKGLSSPVGDVLTTILALFILQEKFEDREDEWTLLAKKAKAWLKKGGLAKPDQWI
jgi:hypothetical protein